MKTIGAIIILVLLTNQLSEVVLSVEQQASDLWDRAIRVSERNKLWIPGKITSECEELDKNGKILKKETITSRLYCDETGKVHREIVHHEVTGGNTGITADIRIGSDGHPEDKNPADLTQKNLEYILFQSDYQKDITKKLKVESQVLDDVQTAVYDFVLSRSSKEKTIGKAWIEKNTGTAVAIEYSPDPLPSGMKNMKTHVKYRWNSDGDCYPAEIVTEGNGNYLLMNNQFRITIEFSDYFKSLIP